MTYLNDALAHGVASQRAGKLTEARSIFESLLSHSLDTRISGAALAHLANIHTIERRLPEAHMAAKKALELNNNNGTALLAVARCERSAGRPESGLALLLKRDTYTLPPALLHEMGLCYEAMGQYGKAFYSFKESKRRISFADLDVNRDILHRYLQVIANRFDGPEETEWTPAKPLLRDSPIFLVGFNESGVSSLGEMLNQHDGFKLASEVPGIDKARASLGTLEPQQLHALSEDDIERARTAYFSAIDAAVPGAGVIIDALPLNAVAIGLIHRLFPESMIIRCVRHPCEAVLRTFFKNYKLNPVTCHFDRLERTTTAYLATSMVSQQVERSLGIEVATIHFEDLMTSPEPFVKAIAQHAGIEWSKPLVFAPRSTLDRWPHYRADLSRWLTELLPAAKSLGYPEK
jgi:tetratricopeptide (TPR) repeat protein